MQLTVNTIIADILPSSGNQGMTNTARINIDLCAALRLTELSGVAKEHCISTLTANYPGLATLTTGDTPQTAATTEALSVGVIANQLGHVAFTLDDQNGTEYKTRFFNPDEVEMCRERTLTLQHQTLSKAPRATVPHKHHVTVIARKY